MKKQHLISVNPIPQSSSRLDLTCYTAICLLLLADAWRLLNAVEAAAPGAPGLGLDRCIVVACFASLLGLGWLASRRAEVGGRLAFLIGATCGALFFASTLGSTILNPESIDWLLRGNDWTTHYAGWAMFRHAPWTWPPGALPTLMYPVGTALVYSDSLPLLALLFKPLAPWLPETFQYTGGWLATSCVLQGGFAALLVQRWTRSAAPIAAAAALFLYAPVLLNRLPHATLTAHWLILASLWLYFRPRPPQSVIREAWPWWLLAGLSALVMPYLAMMVLAVSAAYWIRRSWVDGERRFIEAASVLAMTILLVAALWWLSGAMTIKYDDGNGGVVHGLYSFNLLGFFNSLGWSAILPGFPLASQEQYEGYAYLGLGVICLLAVLLVEALVRRRRPHRPHRHWPLLVVTLLLVAFAASTVLTLGPWTLVNYPLTTPILSTFRSSGRFIWVAYYLTSLGAIVFTLKRFNGAAATLLIGAAFAAQAWDFSQAHLFDANLRSGVGWPPSQHLLGDARWDRLAAGRLHLTLIPPAPCGDPPPSLLPLQLLAAKHVMTFNAAYVARWDGEAETRYCEQLVDQLAKGALSSDELYIVTDGWLARFEQNNHLATCEMVDGFRACFITPATDNPIAQQQK
jgi:Family of unknown function (DUF6311)